MKSGHLLSNHRGTTSATKKSTHNKGKKKKKKIKVNYSHPTDRDRNQFNLRDGNDGSV